MWLMSNEDKTIHVHVLTKLSELLINAFKKKTEYFEI